MVSGHHPPCIGGVTWTLGRCLCSSDTEHRLWLAAGQPPPPRSQTKDNAGGIFIFLWEIYFKCSLLPPVSKLLKDDTKVHCQWKNWFVPWEVTVTAPLLLTGPWKGNMMYSILLQLPALLLQKYTLTFPMSAIKEKYSRNILQFMFCILYKLQV